jgi:hypothetical protein
MKFTPTALLTLVAFTSIVTSTNANVTIDRMPTRESITSPMAIVANDFDLLPIQKNGRWGYVDRQTGKTLKFMYDEADPFNNGVARVRIGGKYGAIDSALPLTWGKQDKM